MWISRSRRQTSSPLRRALAQGGVVPTSATVRLKLPDGSDYGYTGKVEFSQVVVAQNTGTVTLRAVFPNAQALLLPGMFVNAQFAQAIDTSALLGTATGNHARSAGERHSLCRRSRQPSGAKDSRRRSHHGAVLGRDPGPRCQRKGDHSRHFKSEGWGADQTGTRERSRKNPGAATRGDESRRQEPPRLIHVTDFHRATNFRMGPCNHHHARRDRRDLLASSRAISRRSANADQRPR